MFELAEMLDAELGTELLSKDSGLEVATEVIKVYANELGIYLTIYFDGANFICEAYDEGEELIHTGSNSNFVAAISDTATMVWESL